MKNFDLLTLERYKAPKIQDYIAVIGKMTRVMNLRIVKKDDDRANSPYYSLFQCGVDIIPLANGGHIIITTLGFYAFTLVEFVENFLNYQRKKMEGWSRRYERFGFSNPMEGIALIFSDDTDALSSPYDDEDGNLQYTEVEPEYVEDDKLLSDIKSYESLDFFAKALEEVSNK